MLRSSPMFPPIKVGGSSSFQIVMMMMMMMMMMMLMMMMTVMMTVMMTMVVVFVMMMMFSIRKNYLKSNFTNANAFGNKYFDNDFDQSGTCQ